MNQRIRITLKAFSEYGEEHTTIAEGYRDRIDYIEDGFIWLTSHEGTQFGVSASKVDLIIIEAEEFGKAVSDA